MGTKKYYFASANTGHGFVSYLDKINDNNGKNFMYIISGGSGCGKSTMMKKIGEYFFQRGENVEYYLCSSDPTSVDGVRLADKNICVVDGTAPHVINPNLVGVDSKIIDVGQFVDCNIKRQRNKIENLVLQKKQYYKNVNFLLQKLKKKFDAKLKKQSKHIDKNFVSKTAKILFKKIKKNCEVGSSKNLFLGCVNNVKIDLEKQNNFDEIIFKANEFETNLILCQLEKYLTKNNFAYTKILNNINPKIIEKIIINNKILIKNNYFNNYFNKKLLNLIKNEIKKAKICHKQIEKIYVKYINFGGVEKLTNEIIGEIKQR